MAQSRWEAAQSDCLPFGEEALSIRSYHPYRTRGFPGEDIGSDHDLVMMTFLVRLKKAGKPTQPSLRFDLKNLRDLNVACTFQAITRTNFSPLIGLKDDDMDTDTMITTYNTARTDTVSEMLGKESRRKRPGPLNMFSISVKRGQIGRRSVMRQNEHTHTGKLTIGYRRL